MPRIKAKLGLGKAFTPYRRRRPGSQPDTIVDLEGDFNTVLARQRVHVEHAMRRLKTNKILHGYRRHLDISTASPTPSPPSPR